nr:MAG TPA: hypothetical protein [Caudoviricetes sp.]
MARSLLNIKLSVNLVDNSISKTWMYTMPV